MLGGSSGWVGSWPALPAGRVAVVGRSGASGVVALGQGGCGSRWPAVPCGRRGRLVRGPGFGLLGCGGSERRQRAAQAQGRE